MDAAQKAVLLEAVASRRLAADARGVDQNNGNAVVDELRVDGITRGSRQRAHERALVSEQRIQQRGLAHVGPAHDREAVGFRVELWLFGGRRQRLDDAIEEIAYAQPVLRGDQAGL